MKPAPVSIPSSMDSNRAVRAAVRSALIVTATTLVSVPAVYAQTPAAPSSVEPVTEIVVTGSRIQRLEAEASSPVQVISRQDIEKSGQQSVAEIIRSISADNQGSLPTAFTDGFAAGASGVSLRGLGLNSTLVLVNGRRMTTYGLADDGSRTFVDLNTIPMEAIERVEVLKDGASALYGSDAIAGVVNIILRESFEGASVGGSTGTSYADDGTSSRLFGSAGMGNLTTDRYNIFLSVEGSKQDAIAQRDRPWLGGDDARFRGFFDNRAGAYRAGLGQFADGSGQSFSALTPYGTVRMPGGTLSERINLLPCPEISGETGVCLFDRIDYYRIQPSVERENVYAKGTYAITDTVRAYLEAGWFHSQAEAIGTPGNVSDSGVFNPDDPAHPLTAPHTTVLPVGHPDNPTSVSRSLTLLTTFLGGRNARIESDVVRVIGGVKGEFSDWNYDAGVGYIQSDLKREQTGFIRWPVLQDAINAGTFRLDPRLMSPSLIAAISPTLTDSPTSSLALADASISGPLFDLPGGALNIAFGAEYRKEKTDTPPVPFTDVGEIVGLGYSAFSSDRDVYAGYVELSAPVLEQLSVDAAYRYDHYSDFGHSTTPKVGIKWRPIEQIALRGTYSEGFRAPGPTESGNSSSLGFTNIAIISVGDPNVQPETSKSYTVGLLAQPLRDTTVSVDYYRIERANEITQADQAVIVAGLPTTGTPNSSLPGAVPNSFLYYDENGDLSTISGPYLNLNSTRTDGIDLDLRQSVDLGDGGKLSARVLWTHVLNFEREVPSGTKVEYAGTHGPYSLSSAGGTPADRGSLEVTWSRDLFELTGRLNYVSGMKMIDHEGETLVDLEDGTYATTTFEGAYFVRDPNGLVCGVYNPDGTPANGDCRVPSFTTVDLFAKLTLGENLDVTTSVANVFNKRAPFDPYTYGGVNYNPSYHQAGAIGRFLTLGASYRF